MSMSVLLLESVISKSGAKVVGAGCIDQSMCGALMRDLFGLSSNFDPMH